jgi:hypothetical protein
MARLQGIDIQECQVIMGFSYLVRWNIPIDNLGKNGSHSSQYVR